MLILNLEEIKNTKVDFIEDQYGKIGNFNADGEIFRLLYYFSSLFKNKLIIDAGTDVGISALCLGINNDNAVISYDIFPKSIIYEQKYNNFVFKILDINKENEKILNAAYLIYVDIDPHDGIQESYFINKLKKIGYKNYVLCDDIFLNEGMISFWNDIKQKKHDLTKLGHSTGTGLICFDNDIKIE